MCSLLFPLAVVENRTVFVLALRLRPLEGHFLCNFYHKQINSNSGITNLISVVPGLLFR